MISALRARRDRTPDDENESEPMPEHGPLVQRNVFGEICIMGAMADHMNQGRCGQTVERSAGAAGTRRGPCCWLARRSPRRR